MGAIGLFGTWERAPLVVLADLQSVESAGSQKVARLPNPVPAAVHRIYWCRGDLKAYSVVRGALPSVGKKFLWSSMSPGCDPTRSAYGTTQYHGPGTRVWFLREEAEYIRPVVDIGGAFFVGFNVKWNILPTQAPEKHFGQLLLTPSAIDASLRDYAHGFFNLANAACLILGRDELSEGRSPRACVAQVRALADLGDPNLRRAACDFLQSQFGERCRP